MSKFAKHVLYKLCHCNSCKDYDTLRLQDNIIYVDADTGEGYITVTFISIRVVPVDYFHFCLPQAERLSEELMKLNKEEEIRSLFDLEWKKSFMPLTVWMFRKLRRKLGAKATTFVFVKEQNIKEEDRKPVSVMYHTSLYHKGADC